MKEFSLDGLLFVHDYPEDFNKIFCEKTDKPSKILNWYRILEVLYGYAILLWILCLIFIKPKLKPFIFFCTWVQVLTGLTSEFELGEIFGSCKISDTFDISRSGLPWYVKLFWAFFSACLPAIVLSFIIFWSQMYDGDTDPIFIVMGNVTPLLVLIKFSTIAFPLRLLHFLYFFIFCLLYIIFSVTYQKLGGYGLKDSVPIYKFLDWRAPWYAILACLIAILIGKVAYVTFWGINKLKLRGMHR